jgi:ethanolamine utilization protein EutA
LTLGHLIKEDSRVTGEVLVIDGITLWGFDFVDLGRIRMPSMTVPVSIKSLVFSEDPRSHGKSDPAGWHRHGDGALHTHEHDHPHEHAHAHAHAHGHHHDHDERHLHHHGEGHD